MATKYTQKILLDTSFLIALTDTNSALHSHAIEYFVQLQERGYEMYISTIAISEYCAKGDITALPLNGARLISFTPTHAKHSGEIFSEVFSRRSELSSSRVEAKDDIKLFATANSEGVTSFISSDSKAGDLCQKLPCIKFEFIDINQPPHQYFGYLDFKN